jgi:hypothetical protein
MDTIARHPLTALLAVAVFVALALHFGTKPPPAPTRPAPAREETDAPELPAASVGKPMTLNGRVGQISYGEAPFLVLVLGRREVVCKFRALEPETSPVAEVRTGDGIVVRGVVESVGSGSLCLADCELVTGPKP